MPDVVIAILAALFIVLITIGIIVVVKVYSPYTKGKQGENSVAKILGNTKPGEQFVINDLLFKNNSGQSCQIDHIYINKFGIWVIETKNYAGCIYGDEQKREWSQVLAYGNVINKFYNPVKQNSTHIYHLSQYLGEKNIFHNVVVFLSRADISHVASDSVCLIHNLNTIKTKSTDINLSASKMEYYYNKLLELQNSTNISKEEHIQNIHKMQKQLQKGICPRCGGRLELREGKFGQFYGCSNYPKCKFTKNLE